MKFKSFLLTFMSLSLLLACGKDGSQVEQSLTMDPATLTVMVGKTAQLTVVANPTVDASELEWTSSNTAVATVDANGVVTGVQPGSVNIVVSHKASLKKAGCMVTVIEAVAGFSGGDGSSENPYQISTTADLLSLAAQFADLAKSPKYISKSYVQTSDIDMASAGTIAPLCPSNATSTAPFTGVYDGAGYKISNLSIANVSEGDTHYASGLFGYVGKGAIVKGVNLSTAKITAAGQYAGGIVGYSEGAEVSGCSFNGTITSSAKYAYGSFTEASVAGGIVGIAVGGSVKDCSSTGNVNADGQMVGGIVGAAASGAVVSGCSVPQGATTYSAYYVKNVPSLVGGIAGYIAGSSSVSNCSVESSVASRGIAVGGIVGRLELGSVTGSVLGAHAVVTTSACDAGGIVAQLITTSAANEHCVVEGCAAYGNINGGYSVSGIVSHIEPTMTTDVVDIVNCIYSGGEITSSSYNAYGYALAAGISGWVGDSGKNFGTTNIINCATLPGAIYCVGTSGLKGCTAGMFGYEGSMTFHVTGCYSNVQSDDIQFGSSPITSATFTLFGSLYGKCATSKVLYKHVYGSTDIQLGPAFSSVEKAGCTDDCVQISDANMKDGTLLAKLNASVTEYNATSPSVKAKNWVANASGYPVIEGLPADPHPVTTQPKKVSIIGDSISTFYGYTVAYYYCHYPATDGTVTSVDQTYWYQLIYDKMKNAKLEKNISYSGTVVAKTTDASFSGQYWYGYDFCKRFIDQGLGHPDVVLIHGGTNDYIKNINKLATGYDMQGTKYPSDAEFSAMFSTADAATTLTDIKALDDVTFCTAYIKLLKLVKTIYSSAKIVIVIGDYISEGMEKSIIKIADHYGVKYVDLYAVNGFNGITTDPSYNPMPKHDNYCHPGVEAFKFIANKIYTEQGAYLEK